MGAALKSTSDSEKVAMDMPPVAAFISIRFTDSRAVITRIPHSSGRIFSLTCSSPVTQPAAAPAAKAANSASQGFTPLRISMAETTPPRGTVPSTDRSGKSRML